MAGMFYSLEEAAKKLNKTEEEIQQIVRQGRLREFRDGSTILFKVDEIEALAAQVAAEPPEESPTPERQTEDELEAIMADTGITTPEEPSIPPQEVEEGEVELSMADTGTTPPEEPSVPPQESEVDIESLLADTSITPPAEPFVPPQESEVDIESLMSDTSITPPEEPSVPAQEVTEGEVELSMADTGATPTEEPSVPPQEVTEGEVELSMADSAIKPPEEPSAPPPIAPQEKEAKEEDISLTPDLTGEVPAPSDLTNADTAIAGEGVSVLGETDTDYDVTDDTMAETKATTAEEVLEEVEEDVSLDSFGSGSGLLDLSLQADDTSLGGILDEIYAPEGAEGRELEEPASAMDVAAEAEQIIPEEEFTAPQPTPDVPALARAYFEPPPDTQSNTFGLLLFLPLLAIVYTAVVVIAGFNNVMPVILEKVQAYIWYIMIGAAVVAIVIVGMAFMVGGAGATAKPKSAKKARKPKKPKAPKKPKKEKKAKKS